MEFSGAFDVGRAVRHGFAGLKLAWLPLWVGAFLMGLTEGGGGGGNIGDIGRLFDKGNDGGDYDWNGSGSDWNYQLGDLGDHLGQRVMELKAGPVGEALLGQSWQEPAVIGMVLAGLVCVTIIFVALFSLRCWVHPGYIRLHKQVIETGAGDFGTLFSGADMFMKMVTWKLLSGAISFGAILVAALPGAALAIAGGVGDQNMLLFGGAALAALLVFPVAVYVNLGLYVGNHVVVLEGLGAMEALDRTWTLTNGNRLTLFIFAVVVALVTFGALLGGLLMCCIGVLFTVPAARAMMDLGLTESFLLATRDNSETAQWRLPELASGS